MAKPLANRGLLDLRDTLRRQKSQVRILPCPLKISIGERFRAEASHCTKLESVFHDFRNRSAFAMTDTELKLIAAAASIGESRMPKKG